MTDTPDLLYKFLPAEFALKVLEEKRLKVSRLLQLNDVFDCSPKLRERRQDGSLHDMDDQERNRFVRQFDEVLGLVCLARDFGSPLLWGHYAACGTGIAIGFESKLVFRGTQWGFAVDYNDARKKCDISELGMNWKAVYEMFGVKAEAWRYERETRYVVRLEDCQRGDGMHFVPFEQAYVKQVIIGYSSQILPSDMGRRPDALEYKGVQIKVAEPHPDKYEIRLKE